MSDGKELRPPEKAEQGEFRHPKEAAQDALALHGEPPWQFTPKQISKCVSRIGAPCLACDYEIRFGGIPEQIALELTVLLMKVDFPIYIATGRTEDHPGEDVMLGLAFRVPGLRPLAASEEQIQLRQNLLLLQSAKLVQIEMIIGAGVIPFDRWLLEMKQILAVQYGTFDINNEKLLLVVATLLCEVLEAPKFEGESAW